MRRIKTLLIGGLATASLVVVGTLPAAGADTKGTLAIVNGIPGKKVDVCLNGKEIRSGLAYGDKVQKPTVATGPKTIRFYAKDPRTCRGKLLGKKQFALPAAADLTIVVTKNAPKVVVFDNALLGEIPPLGSPTPFSPGAIRSAADVAADVSFRYWINPPTNVPINPGGIFTKGQENRTSNASSSGFDTQIAIQLRATIGANPEAVASPIVETIQSYRYEWILVGTKRANARWVVTERLVSQPSP